MVQVIRSSSVDINQNVVVAEFATRPEACEYIRANTIDEFGNVSDEVECDYLRISDEIED